MNSEQQDSVKRLCISQPIIGYKVLTEEDKAAEKVEVDTTPAIEQVHENLTRPDFLMGGLNLQNQNTDVRARAVHHH